MHLLAIIAASFITALAVTLGILIGRDRQKLRIELVMGDITREKADVIVNAAKSTLLGGGGVDGAIHRAGGPVILEECKALRAVVLPDGLPAGDAVATTAGKLHANWVIHTVGPRYDRRRDQSAVLRSCYIESLALADALGARTIAFPLISAGAYGWPTYDAIGEAMRALRSANTSVRVARLVFFDAHAYRIAQEIAWS
jgi:O-acetyl-ADP-ribose deacetylase